jgi:hypothetical protein
MNSQEPLQAGIDRATLIFTVRKLIRARNRAATATTLFTGGEERPYVSLTATATDIDGGPILLLSKLADHTRNLDRDPRLSMLFEDTGHYLNPQQGPRVTVVGHAERVGEPETLERLRRRFLTRHPSASLYAGFADFGFFKVVLERIHWVGGFGRAAWLNQDLTCPDEAVSAFAAAESDLIRRINADHQETLVHLGRSLLGKRGKHWKAVAADPDGIEISRARRVYRLAFPKPLMSPAEVIPTLSNLAVLGKNETMR